MPSPDWSAYKVASLELSSSTKFDNLVQALQDFANAIPVGNLTPGSNGQILTTSGGVAVWGAGATLGYATSLPGSPVDGQETVLVDSTSAPTYAWRLRYNATLAKWEYMGGRPAFSEVTTSETTASTTYAALATAGPSIVLPVSGDWMVENGYTRDDTVAAVASMSYDIGGTGAVDADNVQSFNSTGTVADQTSVARARIKTGLTAVTLTAKYKASTGTVGFKNRWMRVHPIKL